MVKQFIFSVFFLSTAFLGLAQVAINEDQSSPAAGSILDVKSTTKGILIPRLAANPVTAVTGMFYYNTSINMFKYYNGSAWQIIGAPWRLNESNGDLYTSIFGNVGINTSLPNYLLDVNGSARMRTTLYVGDRLLVNVPATNSVLAIKGSTAYGNWGQHIVLENTSNTDYGAILHDGEGMKFRNFADGDGYFFRDINNSNLFQISSTGNVAAGGNVSSGGNITATGNMQVQGSATVNGGKGVVTNASGATNLKIYQFTVSNNDVTICCNNESVEFSFQFGGGFISTPQVFVGDIDNQTRLSTIYPFGTLVLTVRGCLLNPATGITTCQGKILDVTGEQFNGTIRWNLMAIGN